MTKDKPTKQEYVYCVINTETQERISYWYTRKHDALVWAVKHNKYKSYCKAVRFKVYDMQVLEDA